MAAFQMLLLLCGIALLSAGSSFGQTIVSQDDEDRAINATRELVQRLEQEMPTRIRNVCDHTHSKNYTMHIRPC